MKSKGRQLAATPGQSLHETPQKKTKKSQETYIALLRAVNVGGTGKLPMPKLKSMCVDAGFNDVKTYIASGNVVFSTEKSANEVQAELDTRLQVHFGKPIGLLVRTSAELQAVLRDNPFPGKEGNYTYALFLSEEPPSGVAEQARFRTDEIIRAGRREIYVYYPTGMGKSKMKLSQANEGTARNMNTIAKLVEMSS
eukprot:TRINITY_DN30038_c0_g1_i1.p1 TRINITY_DN30038_c0_g1~~TRINITY_DN30038_c0_g1_i1.p1  ORF type:complete len:196 (+),score=30.35 TRINITY_DN30038_c0_g1_i1:589-1176(+)